MSFTCPYSVSFHTRLLSCHSCMSGILRDHQIGDYMTQRYWRDQQTSIFQKLTYGTYCIIICKYPPTYHTLPVSAYEDMKCFILSPNYPWVTSYFATFPRMSLKVSSVFWWDKKFPAQYFTIVNRDWLGKCEAAGQSWEKTFDINFMSRIYSPNFEGKTVF